MSRTQPEAKTLAFIVVSTVDYEGDEILGVFSDERAAMDFAEWRIASRREGPFACEYVSVQPWADGETST